MRRRDWWLFVFLALVVVAFVYEVIDTLGDLAPITSNHKLRLFVEAIGIIGLFSLGTLSISMRKKTNQLISSLSVQQKRLTDIEAFSRKIIEDTFRTHGLTTTEREVALELLTTKSYEDIAKGRGVSVGTIKAQVSHIYAKLGVNQRYELALIFLRPFLPENV